MFPWITLISTILTWPLISFGALVRLKGAGLACPDWPLCYGKIIPPPGLEIYLEVGHRYLATFLGILILVLFLQTFKSPYRKYRTLASLTLVLVVIQGLLGGLTVLMKLSPPIVVLHLIGGNLLFGTLIFLSYAVFYDSRSTRKEMFPLSRLSRTQGWMCVLILAIMISGGVNSSTYSGYACSAFPGCNEGSTLSFYIGEHPILENPNFFPLFWNEQIHMFHRLLAIVGALIIAWFSWILLVKHSDAVYRRIGIGIMGLIVLEIIVGISNALFHIPIPISLIHTAIAATLFGLLTFSFARSLHDNH